MAEQYLEIGTSTRKREEEIKRIINRASPVVVWPSQGGAVIVAANRDARENRIHSIYDRIACVTLGTFSGGTNLWQHAAIVASTEGFVLSKGDVSCRIIIRQISSLLSMSFHDIRKGPFYGTEAVFVEVSEERDEDYLVHLNYMGFVNTFSEARLFGRLGDPDHNAGGSDDSVDDATEQAERRLREIWDPAAPTETICELLRGEDAFSRLFSANRVEAVVMDRQAVREERYRQVFNRMVWSEPS